MIGTPDTGHEAWLTRRCHDAGRGPHDVSKATTHIDLFTRFSLPADRADAAGVSVDQRGADRRSLEQAEIARGGFGQAGAERRAGRNDLASNSRILVRGKIAETNALQIIAAPLPFVGK